MASERRRLAVVLVVAAALRVSGIWWDGFTLQNPDERFLVMAAERLAVPQGLAEGLDPRRTPANPNNRGIDFYVYGALPPFAMRLVAGMLGVGSLEGLAAVGRVLVVSLDLLTLLLVASLARRAGGARAGLIAAALWATCGVALQQARFATVDVWGTAAVVAAAWLVVGVPASLPRLALSGAVVGVAAACKPNLAAAILIPAVAAVLAWWDRRAEAGSGRWGALIRLGVVGVCALAALKVADPGAFASPFSLLPNPRRLAALGQLGSIFAGEGQYPPNLQWADRRALLDPLANLFVWGTGPLLGLAIVAGLGCVSRRAVLGQRTWLPVLVWLLPAAAFQLTRFVCSVRHLGPFLPFALVAAAVWLARRPPPWLRAVVVVATVLWGTCWASMAWRPHTRVEASRWITENLPPGSVVTAEYWDDALPLAGHGAERYETVTLRVFDPDTAVKRKGLVAALERADAVVITSQRGVGSICRVPDAYPLTSEFYHLLFTGALGFDLAASFERRLGWGALSLSDLRAEEALSVYDHPPVWIFRKTSRFTRALAESMLERVPLAGLSGWRTSDLEARGDPPYSAVAPGGNPLPGALLPGPARQVWSVAVWVALWELLGLVGRRVVVRVAPGLPDGGWGAARWVGGAVAGLAWLWLGSAGLPGWNGALPLVAAVAAVPWGVREWRRAWGDRRFRVASAVTWSTFAVFLALRAGNPEIYWGEKPMDASILAALWRAGSLPPGDPWFAGAPLGYYFFGFLPHALVGRAGAVGLGLAFNLAAATVPALAAGAALSLGWLLSGRAAGGALAAVLTQLTGSAAALFRPGFFARPDFNGFWASSRVIPDTINEYPVWTALFADLHAHFLAFPGFLVAVLAISAVALRLCRGRPAAIVVGAAVAIEWMTNSWEAPALLVLVVSARLVGSGGLGGRRRLVRTMAWLAVAATTAIIVSLPFWLLVRQAGGAVGWARGSPPTLIALAELFGIAVTLLAVAASATFLGGGPDHRALWAWALAAVGCLLVFMPELVTVADHMNTTFKLHLQAHLLLAAAAGSLLAAAVPSLGPRSRRAAAVAATVVIAVGLATAVAGALAVTRCRRVAGPRPTLDGTAYLAVHSPEMAAALERLAGLREARVTLEPTGPPYSDTLRVPMFTGNPAVVGWEYHLWQRRRSWSEIHLRQDDVEVLTWGADPAVVAATAARYGVSAACGFTGAPPAVAGLPGWLGLRETPGVSLGPLAQQWRRR